MSVKVKVEVRDPKTEGNKALRRRGMIPAVYFHHHEDSVSLMLSEKEYHKMVSAHDSVVKLSNGKSAVVKTVDLEPVSGKVLHVNFQGVVKGEVVSKKVPVHLNHSEKPNWMKNDLRLVQVVNEVEVEATAENLPESLEVNVDDMTADQVVTVGDVLATVKKVTSKVDSSTEVAHLAKQKVQVEEVDTESVVDSTTAEAEKVEESKE
jgi:large subunit ribosomal protein L25